MKKREPSCTVGGNTNWYRHYTEQYDSLKKLGTELPYNPTIPLLGKYPEKTITERDTSTPMFIAALFTIARTLKQPRCPLDRWLDKEGVVHIHNGILLSYKKEHIWVSSNEMDKPKAYYWRRKWQPTPVFLPRESRRQRSLVRFCPWGCTESNTTEAS